MKTNHNTYTVSFDCGEYRARDGRIVSPGKFEGESDYLPMYWDAYLMGMCDDDDGEVLTFEVTADDKARFPTLGQTKQVRLYEDEQGFVRELEGEE